MPRHEAPVYRRGKYWLDWDRRADGTLRSPNLTVFWYDPAKRRVCSASTGATSEDEAVLALNRRYLADADEAPAYCEACGRPFPNGRLYLLADAVADYRLEWGDGQSSADTIAARLNHVLDFLEAETARGAECRFGIDTSCEKAATSAFAEAFRAWSRLRPVEWRNKAGEVTVSRPRSPATTEESVLQVCAVINHACDAAPARATLRPAYGPLPRRQVSRPRRIRVDVPVLAAMLRYAAEPRKRRGSLHAFLVASICTLARPDSVVDICVDPARRQWSPSVPGLDLNPAGREQTRKYRSVVPVVGVLHDWLTAELVTFNALPDDERRGRGYLVNYYGRPVQDVDSAWEAMLRGLDLPRDREMMPYLIRHSMATLARNRGASKWDLEGMMGHRAPGQTEVYAIGEFPTAERAVVSVLEEIETLTPGALHRNHTGAGSSVIQLRRS